MLYSIFGLSDSVTFWLASADLVAKATVVLLLAAACAWAARRTAAAVRHGFWSIAIVTLLALPFLGLLLPQWRVVVWTDVRRVAEDTVTAASPTTAPPVVAPRIRSSEIEVPLEVTPTERSDSEVATQPTSPRRRPNEVTSPPLSASTRIRLPAPETWILLLWTAGAAIVLFAYLRGIFSMRRLTRSARPMTGQDWHELLGQISQRIGLQRRVILKQSERVEIPMTWGFLRPLVLLPYGAESWPAGRREAVLLHELSHVRRGDAVPQFVAVLACMLYWWHPLVWMAAWRLRVEREKACDDQVLLSGVKASSYASHLVEIARSLRRADSLLCPVTSMAHRSQLRSRVAAILDDRIRRQMSRTLAGLIFVTVTAAMLLLACMRLSSAEQEQVAAAEDAAEVTRTASVSWNDRGDASLPPRAIARLGTNLLYHCNRTDALAFSPDGSVLVSSAMGTVGVWECSTGRPLHRFVPTSQLFDKFHRFVFLAEDRILGLGYAGRGGNIRLLDITRQAVLPDLPGPYARPGPLAVSTDHQLMVTAHGDNHIRVWDLPASRLIREFAGPREGVGNLGLSADAKTLYTFSGVDCVLRSLDITTGRQLAEHQLKDSKEGLPPRTTFTPNGARLACVRRGLLQVCESETGRVVWENQWTHDPAGLAISNDGTRIAVARRDEYRRPNRLSRDWDVQVWSAETGREIRALSFYPRRQYDRVALSFSPDGATLAAAPGQLYNRIRLWDLETGEQRVPPQGHEGGIRNLVFSQDGQRIATTDLESVRVWDVSTGRQTNHIVRSDQSEAIGFSPDDEVVVVGENNRGLMWFNLNDGTATRKSTGLADIWRIAVSPDGNTVALSDGDEGFAIWFVGGRTVKNLDEHWDRVNALAFSSDGGTLVSGSDDRTVVVWDTKTFRPRRTLEGPTEGIQGVSVSDDGRFVAATARDNPSYVWDAATGEVLHQLDGTHVVISPDGRIMAARVSEGVERHQVRYAIVLWDLASGKELLRLRLQGFDNWCRRLAFSPDGTILASAHGNHALLWDITELRR